ncbi:MAG: hypothetical protein LKK08_01185 [Bacteroidales bacterium]|nr:hypothetical protein [Bacteroidales bacterium]MCI2144856.1 hypothetical protein [Bacteroidales bacterium]
MSLKKSILPIVSLALLAAGCSTSAQVGRSLPLWRMGELDIHFINTARGESTYQILPDGTTFLVDASGALLAFGVEKSDPLPAKPSGDITAGKVIVDYIDHFSPEVSKGHINYLLITHLDNDHIGSLKDSLPLHQSGLFRMTSLAEIGSDLIIDNFMDRSYPDYTFPESVMTDKEKSKLGNYTSFLDWSTKTNGTKVEKWEAGGCTQVVPVHDKKTRLTVRNYSGNGRFWTGEGTDSFTTMPSAEDLAAAPAGAIPAENVLSCSYILTFGDFDFFLGGDLQFGDAEEYTYKDAEAPVAKVAHKVELMKADHHGTYNANGEELMSVLRPDVWVVCNWRDVQPRPATVDRVLAANPECKIYCTNMPEANIPRLGERMARIDPHYGHIVVRVSPDGESYKVYTLEDTDEKYIVTSIEGPFQCKK